MAILKYEGGPYDGQTEWSHVQCVGSYMPVWLPEPRLYDPEVPGLAPYVIDKGWAYYYRTDIVTIRGETLYRWLYNHPDIKDAAPARDLTTTFPPGDWS